MVLRLGEQLLERRAAAQVAGAAHAGLQDVGDAQLVGDLPRYSITEVREMTRISGMLASVVRMSSCIPSEKNAGLSLSSLRFANGSTAMDF